MLGWNVFAQDTTKLEKCIGLSFLRQARTLAQLETYGGTGLRWSG